MKELTAEVADLERRLTRQLINLEADDLTPSLRRRINGRVSELEDAIVERNQRLSALAEQAATETPSLDDVAPLLDRIPVLAENLADMPQAELRALFDRLQLEVAYHPAESALDVSITLFGEEGSPFSAAEASEDCSVPPVGFEPTLERF